MSVRLQSNYVFKDPTWLKFVHCMLKLSLKLAIKSQGDPPREEKPQYLQTQFANARLFVTQFTLRFV